MKNRNLFVLMCLLVASACNSPSIFTSTATPDGNMAATVTARPLTTIAGNAIPTPSFTRIFTPTITPTPVDETIRIILNENDNYLCLWKGELSNLSDKFTAALPSTIPDQREEPTSSYENQVTVFLREDLLWAANTDGTNERLLTPASALAPLIQSNWDVGVNVYVFDYLFAPWNHNVYFSTYFQREGWMMTPDYNLAVVNTDDLSIKLLLPDDEGGRVTFSPDQTKFAVASVTSIKVLNADGSAPKTVLTFPQVSTYTERSYFPELIWKPDGSGFHTVIPPQDPLGIPLGPTRFVFVPITGGEAKQLGAFVAPEWLVSFSPNGDKVAYWLDNGNGLDAHVVDSSGNDEKYFSCSCDSSAALDVGWSLDAQGIIYWTADPDARWLDTSDGSIIPLCNRNQFR